MDHRVVSSALYCAYMADFQRRLKLYLELESTEFLT